MTSMASPAADRSPQSRHPLRYLLTVLGITVGVILLGLLGVYYMVDYIFGKSRSAIYQLEVPEAKDAGAKNLRRVTIYFTAEDRRLHPQRFTLPKNISNYEVARFIMKELTEGPSSGHLLSPLPRGCRYRGLFLHGKTVVIDFESDFPSLFRGGTGDEVLGLYAIANSLLKNLDSYGTVRILVDGEQIDATDGGIDLREPFRENLSLYAPAES